MTKYTGPFQDKNIPSKGTASNMTHSTCCKAEVKVFKNDVLEYEYCGKCGQPSTPPPVPSEMEGEIREILESAVALTEVNELHNPTIQKEIIEGSIADLTALYTHHTSVQVKEAVEKIQNLNWWNKLYVQNTYGHYVTIGQEVLDDIIKIITAQAAEGEGI